MKLGVEEYMYTTGDGLQQEPPASRRPQLSPPSRRPLPSIRSYCFHWQFTEDRRPLVESPAWIPLWPMMADGGSTDWAFSISSARAGRALAHQPVRVATDPEGKRHRERAPGLPTVNSSPRRKPGFNERNHLPRLYNKPDK